MIVRPGLLFFLLYSLSLTLRTVRLLSYLLHALPSPLLYYIRVHQYLLMCTLCAPFMPVFPHRYLMYHCTLHARFPTVEPESYVPVSRALRSLAHSSRPS